MKKPATAAAWMKHLAYEEKKPPSQWTSFLGYLRLSQYPRRRRA
jgi:hypothetical protein